MNELTKEPLSYMRPNTPHMVVTVDSAICHGGHFYATSTLVETNYGFFNSFLGSTLITNTQHTSDAQLMLRRMIAYFRQVYFKDGGLIPFAKNIKSYAS